MDADRGTPERRLGRAVADEFAHVDAWIFDLDGTLYPAATGLERELLRRVVLFLAERLGLSLEDARARHRDYFERFGATLTAVVQLHGIAPSDFIDFVHDIDLTCLKPDPGLADALEGLPGRRLVFTNGSRRHAERVLDALALTPLFEAIGHIEGSGYVGKPQASAYDHFVSAFKVDPRQAAMFDDRPANLAVPHSLGMRTVLVQEPGSAATDTDAPDHATDDLVGFLAGLRSQRTPTGTVRETVATKGALESIKHNKCARKRDYLTTR